MTKFEIEDLIIQLESVEMDFRHHNKMQRVGMIQEMIGFLYCINHGLYVLTETGEINIKSRIKWLMNKEGILS